MKFKRSEKYETISIYAFITIALSAVVVMTIANIGGLSKSLDKFFNIISPITYGFVIAYLLNPVMNLFERKVFRFRKAKKDRVVLRRVLSLICAYIVMAAIIAAFIILLVPQIASSYNELSANFSSYMNSALKWADNFVKNSRLFNGRYEGLSDFIDVNEITTDFKSLISGSFKVIETASNYVIAYAGKFVIEVKNLFIGIILSIYFLWSKKNIAARIKKLIASVSSRKTYLNTVNLTRFTHEAFGSYIIGKILDSVIVGLLLSIVLGIFGIPFYPVISLALALCNFIPVFGPIIGTVPTGFIILVSEPKKLILFVILVIAVMQLDANIIEPKILGQKNGIPAMWVMISITLGGGFFGIAGMVLAVPTFSVIYTLLKQATVRRLSDKGSPTDTVFYESDPPATDFSENDVIIHKNEEVPEDLEIKK